MEQATRAGLPAMARKRGAGLRALAAAATTAVAATTTATPAVSAAPTTRAGISGESPRSIMRNAGIAAKVARVSWPRWRWSVEEPTDAHRNGDDDKKQKGDPHCRFPFASRGETARILRFFQKRHHRAVVALPRVSMRRVFNPRHHRRRLHLHHRPHHRWHRSRIPRHHRRPSHQGCCVPSPFDIPTRSPVRPPGRQRRPCRRRYATVISLRVAP